MDRTLKCARCGETSGNDWKQCGNGPCPMNPARPNPGGFINERAPLILKNGLELYTIWNHPEPWMLMVVQQQDGKIIEWDPNRIQHFLVTAPSDEVKMFQGWLLDQITIAGVKLKPMCSDHPALLFYLG